VIWTWRRASRAEQLLVAAIVFNVGTYLVSVMPSPGRYREVAAVVPCGAVLAARALVPARITAMPLAAPGNPQGPAPVPAAGCGVAGSPWLGLAGGLAWGWR
jgi:hypothetical protein